MHKSSRAFLFLASVSAVGCSATGTGGGTGDGGTILGRTENPTERTPPTNSSGGPVPGPVESEDPGTEPTGDTAGVKIANVSYGGSGTSYDITLSLTGSPSVSKLTAIALSFGGSGDTVEYLVSCSNAPWTAAQQKVVELRAESGNIVFPCGVSTGYASGNYVSAVGSPDLTVTFKGIGSDAKPWSVSATGKKR